MSKNESESPAPNPASQRFITSTTSEISGYRITRCYGMVRVAIREKNGLPSFKNAEFEMQELAMKRGCNAVVCVRFVSSTASWGGEFSTRSCTEVLCYGTAVVIEPH